MDRSGPARKKDRGKQPAVLNKLIAIDSEPPGLCGVDSYAFCRLRRDSAGHRYKFTERCFFANQIAVCG
jgi:hypothetical protein